MRKKFIVFVAVLSMCFSSISSKANKVNTIVGLSECYESLWIRNNIEDNVKDNIEQCYNEYCAELKNQIFSAPQYQRDKIGLTGTLEEQEQKFDNSMKIDYNNGFSVWFFDSEDYLLQYSANDVTQYLINSENYWAIPYSDQSHCAKFTQNGNFTSDADYEKSKHIGTSFITDLSGNDFLKDMNLISNLLIENNIGRAYDMKIIIVDSECTVLYVNSGNEEYMIRIHNFTKWVPEFEMFKVYKASDAINLIANSTGLMSETKETFETEAVTLQNEGLLKGNESGLDLLKPLTRIEAVTMLLRAIGQEPAATTLKETFADVPTTHWGCAAAAKAEELGIVNGVGDNLFAPDKRVTATEFSTMVLRAAQETDFDWTQALNTLVETGIITDEDTEDMSLFTRGDMAKIIYEARNKGLLK